MTNTTHKYSINSGEKNGFYCLYVLLYDYTFDGQGRLNGKYEYWSYVKNLSTNRKKAIQKARDYIGVSDYDFNVNFDLNDWEANEKKDKFNGYHNDNAHVVSYYEHKEFIDVIDFPFNNDKQTFSGKIILTYWKENPMGEFYPSVNKMWFLDDRGFVLNLTVPKKLSNNLMSLYGEGVDEHNMYLDDKYYKGVRFSFDAILNEDTYTQEFTLEHENCSQDLKCAFVKRPTKIIMED
tara:strand:+ start:867 stop:1574 length:708 start_codon:yes stop_codon:yes gene_type:complete